MNEPMNENNAYRAPKNIVLCVVLCFVTCGIYSFFWMYGIIRDSKVENREESGAGLELFLNLFIPFYNLYWAYKNGKRLNDAAEKKGIRIEDKTVVYLLCNFFGFQIVTLILMQIDLNKLGDKKRRAHARRQTVEEEWVQAGDELQQLVAPTSSSEEEMTQTNMQMLRELAELKERGILTEEEFQTKKMEVLKKM